MGGRGRTTVMGGSRGRPHAQKAPKVFDLNGRAKFHWALHSGMTLNVVGGVRTCADLPSDAFGASLAATIAGSLFASNPAPAELWTDAQRQAVDQFLLEYRHRVWLSYRSGFAPIGHTNLTADTSWGCVLRSAQMLATEAFLRRALGPNYPGKLKLMQDVAVGAVSDADQVELAKSIASTYKLVLSWFHDTPSPTAPYSIHQLAITGEFYKTAVGQWHSPTSCGQVFTSLIQQHRPFNMTAMLSRDGSVYRSEAIKCAYEDSKGTEFHGRTPC